MKKYNADEKANENSLEVTIGGQVFYAKEPTLAVMKKIAEQVPDEKKDDERSESEKMLEGIESIYPQLEILLSDPESGAPPAKAFIEEHLSMVRAGEIIQTLMGEEGAKNPR